MRIFNLEDKSCNILAGHTGIVVCLDVFAQSRIPLLATGARDNSVRLWNTETQRYTILLLLFALISVNMYYSYSNDLSSFLGASDCVKDIR